MRTATFETSGSISYPSKLSFAFNPMIIKIVTQNEVTFSVESGGVAYEDKRQSFNNSVELDISQYCQLFFEVGDDLMGMKKVYVTIKTDKDELSFLCNVIWGAMAVGERFNGSRKVIWFKKYPFTLSSYVSSIATVSISADGGASKTIPLSQGLHHLDISQYINPEKTCVFRIDEEIPESTFDYSFDGSFRGTGNGIVEKHIIVDDSDCGIYLRWIDRHGFYQYYLFAEGENTDTSKSLENFEELWTDECRYYSVVRHKKSNVSSSIKACAINVDNDIFEYVRSVVSSPLVDMYIDEMWVPVNIANMSTVTSDQHLRDFEIEILIPDKTVQQI